MTTTLEAPVLWSRDAEQALLGGLMLDPQALDRVGGLAGGDFFDQRHAAIFGAVQSLAAARQPADTVTVFERLQAQGAADEAGGLEYLAELAHSVPSAANVHRYAQIVREKAANRALLTAADTALSIAAGAGDTADKLERIAALFQPLQRSTVRKAPRRIGEIANERMGHYEALADGRTQPGWQTHIPALDRALNGGLRPGGLYILAARPSVGKSSFAQQIGAALARDGHPTLMLSQEMPDVEVVDRAVSNAGRIDFGGLQRGDMAHDDWGRAADALDHLAALPMWVDDQGALRLQDIRTKARLVPGLQVLVVDYLQLCASTARDANRNSQIEEISRGLKALAKELGLAVVALSQLNRQVESRAVKKPNLGDLRDSGAIEQDADVVMFLWPVRDLGDHRIVGCGLEKNRQGRCMEFALDFHGATQRWHESTASLEPPTRSEKRGSFE